MTNLKSIQKQKSAIVSHNLDVKKSIEKAKALLKTHNDSGLELCRELNKAREYYTSQGRRTDLTSGQNVPKSWEEYCDAIGLIKRTANRKLLQYDPKNDCIIEDKSKAHVGHNTGFYEWYTPSEIIESARECMGSIDLDPASCIEANKTVKAEKIYTEKENGIEQRWKGNIWLNPPYKNELITKFANRLNEEIENGMIETACAIVNNATETEWFQLMIQKANAICFPKGRVKFYDVSQEHKSAPLQGQAILYYGNDIKSFYTCFSKHGFIVEIIHDGR